MCSLRKVSPCLCAQLFAAARSRLHHANVLELYAVFEDAEAYYFVMQCVSRLRANTLRLCRRAL